jgi:hypothetical protein
MSKHRSGPGVQTHFVADSQCGLWHQYTPIIRAASALPADRSRSKLQVSYLAALHELKATDNAVGTP